MVKVTRPVSFSRDMHNGTELDCPECRAPGKATLWRHRRTNERLLFECEVCGLHVDYDAPASTDAPSTDDATPATDTTPPDTTDTADPVPFSPATDNIPDRFMEEAEQVIQHSGAGWYVLSDGGKKRGLQNAVEAQALLLMVQK